jgi:hypothetical protein
MFSQLGATGEVIALGLTLFAHILGGFALIYTLVRDSGENVRDWWPGDDDGGSPRSPEPPTPGDGGGDLPLPGAEPSAVRLREAGSIGDGYPRPPRRPAHVPEREPARTGQPD